MKFADLLALDEAGVRKTIHVNPTYILAVRADPAAPTQRSLVSLAQPVPNFGDQLICTLDIKVTIKRINDASSS